MSLSLSVFSQSGPPKSVGGGQGGRGGRGGSYTTLQLVNIQGWQLFFFFFFFVSGLKLDEKSIENGLEGQKFLVVCLFWGGCHHPNTYREIFSFTEILCYLTTVLIPTEKYLVLQITSVTQQPSSYLERNIQFYRDPLLLNNRQHTYREIFSFTEILCYLATVLIPTEKYLVLQRSSVT